MVQIPAAAFDTGCINGFDMLEACPVMEMKRVRVHFDGCLFL